MITILLEVTLTKYSSSLKKSEIDSLVLPLSVVDNSVASSGGILNRSSGDYFLNGCFK